MRLFSLMMALSLSISAVGAKNVKTHKHANFDQPQAIALKLFGSKEEEKKADQQAKTAEQEDKKAQKEDKKAAKEEKKADKRDKAAAKVEAKKDVVKAAETREQPTAAAVEKAPENAAEKPVEKAAEPESVKAVEPVQTPPRAVKQKPPVPIAHATSEAPADPATLDTALVSVLRDIDKALREDEGVPTMDNAPQHAAIAAALQTLDVALERAKINPNRIVLNEHKPKFESGLTAESWDSGDIELPNGSHASLAVLWAKKVNGLVNVSITGNCGCHPNYAGERVGEWVVVLNGKSTLDSGFDIQSQADVNFWLGKLNSFNVDATACGEQVSSGGEHSIDLKQAKALTLKAVTTEQKRKLLAEAAVA
jgi:hypothetical protein